MAIEGTFYPHTEKTKDFCQSCVSSPTGIVIICPGNPENSKITLLGNALLRLQTATPGSTSPLSSCHIPRIDAVTEQQQQQHPWNTLNPRD